MWKFSQYGVELLTLLLRHDVATPPAAVQLFVSNLIHDSIYIRKVKCGVRELGPIVIMIFHER